MLGFLRPSPRVWARLSVVVIWASISGCCCCIPIPVPAEAVRPLSPVQLVFDRASGTLGLLSTDGEAVGQWPARNNVVRDAEPFPLGTYAFDYSKAHPDDAPGSAFGSHGIIVFKVPGRSGLGVHSGRADARSNPGPEHPTLGCIRTTDEAMGVIVEATKVRTLTGITVR